MYSPKRRLRLFRNPAFASNPVAYPFLYTGSDQTIVVPPTTTSIRVYAWGAGGGGGLGGNGGVGAMVQGVITVTPGETLRIIVGQAGDGLRGQIAGKTYGGGGKGGNLDSDQSSRGGGRSAVARGANDIVTAGAGGGGRAGLGGRGGLTTGGDGASSTNPGLGGTQTAGGSNGGGLNSGGDALQDNSGGGGSGFYGGGGGVQDRAGGGGSSLTSNLSLISGESVLGFESPNNIAAPNSTSIYYAAGVALGGVRGTNTGQGGNGRVVLVY